MNNKKIWIPLLLALFLIIVFLICVIGIHKEKSDSPEAVVATVEKEKIYESDIRKKLSFYEIKKANLQQQLDQATDQELIDRLKSQLAEYEKSDSELRADVLNDLIDRKLIKVYCARKGITVSDEEVDQMYDEQINMLETGIQNNDQAAIDVAAYIKEYQKGADLTDEEVEEYHRKGYREILMLQKFNEYYQEHNPDYLSYEDWFKKEMADISVKKEK